MQEESEEVLMRRGTYLNYGDDKNQVGVMRW